MTTPRRSWWPFRGRKAAAQSLPEQTPPSSPPRERNPLAPPPPANPFSAFWATGQVPARANTFLDTIAQIVALAKIRNFQVLGLHEGSTVLDVACGNGRDVASLMSFVGATGEVWGVDSSPALIEEAKAAHPRALFVVGNAFQLPFKDHFFDAVRAERLLMHLDDPDRALAEMIRVTKPGGIVSVMDPDIEATQLHPCDPVLSQRMMSYTGRRLIKHPRVEMELYDKLVAQGAQPLLEITAGGPMTAELMRADMAGNFATSLYSFINPAARMHAVQAGVITEAESNLLAQNIERGLEDGTFLMTGHMLLLYFQAPEPVTTT